MKRVIFAALIAIASTGLGCRNFDNAVCGPGCRGGHGLFGHRGCGILGHRHGCGCGARGVDDGAYAGGPPTGQVTYPYYTNRGPRDFLAENPRGIGP